MVEERLKELKLQLNYVCYDKELMPKLSKVWDAFFELESEVEKLNIASVSGKRLIDIVEQEIKYAPTVAMKNHLQRILEAACASGVVDTVEGRWICDYAHHNSDLTCFGYCTKCKGTDERKSSDGQA